MLREFLEILTGAGVAGAVVVFLGRAIVTHWLSKDLESFRIQLRTASEKELERMRNDLERAATEHRIRFSHLHERQAEVIAEVFGRLERVHQAFKKWMSPMQPGGVDMFKLRDETAEAYLELVRYYYPHAIWLDPDTCNAINELIDGLWESFIDFAYDLDSDGFPKDKRQWVDTWKKVQKEVPEARARLDRRFRQILGVPNVMASEVNAGRVDAEQIPAHAG